MVGAARPRAGHHDRAFPARLQPAPDQDLPSPRRPRDGRHGGADPDQERSGRQRARRMRQACAPTRSARRPTATTAPGSPIPASSRSPRTAFDAVMQGSQPDRAQARRTSTSTAADLITVPEGTKHRSRPAPERGGGHRLCRGLAARHRLRAALQPDGGRRDGRDLPRTGLAVGAPRPSCRTAGPMTRSSCARSCVRQNDRSRRRWARRPMPGPLRGRRPAHDRPASSSRCSRSS